MLLQHFVPTKLNSLAQTVVIPTTTDLVTEAQAHPKALEPCRPRAISILYLGVIKEPSQPRPAVDATEEAKKGSFAGR